MFAEQTVSINGQVLNYAHSGASQPGSGDLPLLFLHGVSRRWQSFLPLLPQLSGRYEVYALDQRGHGKSSLAKSYHVVDYIEDAVNFVRQVIQRPTVIYGHSLGAMVAAGVASKLPELTVAAILEDPPFRAMGDKIAEGPLKSLMAGMQMYAGDSRIVSDIARDFAEVELHNPRTGKTVRMGDVRDAVAIRFSSRSLQDVDPQVFTCIIAGAWLRGYDMEQIFRTIQAPTLLLQADESAGGMLNDEDAQLMKAHVQQFSHLQFPGIPHLMHWAITERILNHVWGFIESIDTGR